MTTTRDIYQRPLWCGAHCALRLCATSAHTVGAAVTAMSGESWRWMLDSELAISMVSYGLGARPPARGSHALLQAQLCEHPPRLVSVPGGRHHRPPRPHQLHAHMRESFS